MAYSRTINLEDEKNLKTDFDPEIFQNIEYYSHRYFDDSNSHKAIAKDLQNKSPYSIIVYIDRLKYENWRKKEFVKKTKVELIPKYKELLFKYAENEFGGWSQMNNEYAKWLEKYKNTWDKKKYKDIDEHIIHYEMESRYKEAIFRKYRNHEKLMEPRFEIRKDRYYRLPEPFTHVDWRNPFDNIFVWSEGDKKYTVRGGTGGSGGREINTKYSYAFSLINQKQKIPTYLFLYDRDNELKFITKLARYCTVSDVGCNYHPDREEVKQAMQGCLQVHYERGEEFYLKELTIRENKSWYR